MGANVMDWSTVFDEIDALPGATEDELRCFIESLQDPLTAEEIREINEAQQNPFPKSDPLFNSYRPLDPSRWTMPGRPLPPMYLDFLSWSNGGEFRSGDRWFQFFPALDTTHGVRAMLLAYHVPAYMQGFLPFAFNGEGTFYLFDMREPSIAGEYPVVCTHSGNLGGGADECARIAESFLSACQGKINVDDLQE
jgi:hypothetical protein